MQYLIIFKKSTCM